MTGENTSNNMNSDTKNLPEKILSRLHNAGDDLARGDRIIGDGENELKSDRPVAVVDYFLATNRNAWAKKTYRDYSYDLTRLLEYCEYAGIDELSAISAADIEEFEEWRKRDEYIALVSIHGQLANIRMLLRWAGRVGLVDGNLADEIEMPDLDRSDNVSYTRLFPEQAEQIIQYYNQFEYVPRRFAEMVLMWEALCRRGDCRALDIEDYDRENQYIELKHRPEQDTPLKNQESEVEGEGGERKINLPDWVCDILNSYIDGTDDPEHPKRIEQEDEYGRNPLLTTKYGRVSGSTIQRDLYRITQPCRFGEDCPHDQKPKECEARNNNRLSRCESTVSPHPVRRGGICNQLKQGVSKDTICGRADVSRKVLNKHYDLRTKEEARQQRRTELGQELDGYESDISGPSLVQNTGSMIADRVSPKARSEMPLQNITRDRAVRGVGGYICFTLLVALNFSLMGVSV